MLCAMAATAKVQEGISQIVGGVQKILDPIFSQRGKSKYEKELDDIFALDDKGDTESESSSSEFIDPDDNSKNTEGERLQSMSSLETKQMSEQQPIEDIFDDFRKNNHEED